MLFQTAILSALLAGNEEEALAFKASMATKARPAMVDATWHRASDAVARLRESRGPAGVLTLDDDWTDEHRRLWTALVPKSGRAATVQGELIRCTGRLTDEAYRNGNMNFGASHLAMIDFVERTLSTGRVFAPDELEAIERDTASLREPEHLDLAGHDSSYYRLSACAVRWCRAHPAPLALTWPDSTP